MEIIGLDLGCQGAFHPPLSSSQSPLGSISAWRRKLRPLPCSSSPHRNRSAYVPAGAPFGLAEKKTGRTRKGYAASVSGKAANGCAMHGPKEKNA